MKKKLCFCPPSEGTVSLCVAFETITNVCYYFQNLSTQQQMAGDQASANNNAAVISEGTIVNAQVIK